MVFKVDDCIFFQLARAGQAGTRYWGGCVARFGITAAQGMVLNFLGQADEVTARELGKRTSLDSATVTGILDRLEAAGLVERKPHPKDRRAILVCLTGSGKKTAGELYAAMVRANEEFLAGLNAQDQQALRVMLGKIRQNLPGGE